MTHPLKPLPVSRHCFKRLFPGETSTSEVMRLYETANTSKLSQYSSSSIMQLIFAELVWKQLKLNISCLTSYHVTCNVYIRSIFQALTLYALFGETDTISILDHFKELIRFLKIPNYIYHQCWTNQIQSTEYSWFKKNCSIYKRFINWSFLLKTQLCLKHNNHGAMLCAI